MSIRRRAILNLSFAGYGVVRKIGDSDSVSIGSKVYSTQEYHDLLDGVEPDPEVRRML